MYLIFYLISWNHFRLDEIIWNAIKFWLVGMNSHKVMSWVCMPCVLFWTATKRTVKVISNFQSLSCIMMITKEKLCWKEITKESVGWNQLFSDCYMHVCAKFGLFILLAHVKFEGDKMIELDLQANGAKTFVVRCTRI